MNTGDVLGLSGIALIAIETSYLTWRSLRSVGSRSKFDHPIFVDTSVLMDGRIVGVASTGFITGELVIPRSVILELQLLADKADHDKRERARFGLDVVASLQEQDTVRVRMFHDEKATNGVDERLLELARTSKGIVLTLDFNLQKVAATEHIRCLNINELAQQLRMEHLPGERLSLSLVEKGSDSHQAIGYLGDGTMVVVEHAHGRIGKTETVEIIRSLQTAAGRMCFAKLVNAARDESNSKPVKKAAAGRKPQPAKKTTNQKEPKPMQPAKKQSPSPQRNAQTQEPKAAQQQPAKSNRPKTSKQREADLLRVINDQQE